MKVNQISVFLENKKGRLTEVCTLLGNSDINIRALTVAESEDFGVLRIVVDKPEKTLEALKASGFVANQTDIVAVEVADRPGGLARVLKLLSDADVNIEYMYGFVEKHGDSALLVFRFEKPDEATQLLQSHGVRVLQKEDIVNL